MIPLWSILSRRHVRASHRTCVGGLLWHEYERQAPRRIGPVGPRAEPIRPDEVNRSLIQAHEDIPRWAEHTCKLVLGPPPPPKPEPAPKPIPAPKPRPPDDEPPF